MNILLYIRLRIAYCFILYVIGRIDLGQMDVCAYIFSKFIKLRMDIRKILLS